MTRRGVLLLALLFSLHLTFSAPQAVRRPFTGCRNGHRSGYRPAGRVATASGTASMSPSQVPQFRNGT